MSTSAQSLVNSAVSLGYDKLSERLAKECLLVAANAGGLALKGTTTILATGQSGTVTNSAITASSIVYPVIATHDATAFSVQAVPTNGSVTFFMNAPATGNVEIRYTVLNP